ncbi:isocitrate lyase/phosphoenolpyruvate mutase family protein, partial [Streptomyces sp. NPDC059627]
MDTQRRERAVRFVESHRDGCFLLPNAWDAGSARVLESAGLPAVGTTNAGLAISRGRADHHNRGGRGDRATNV